MKVAKSVTVELAITEFDDRKVWLHVALRRQGMPARVVLQTRAVERITDDVWDHALAVLEDTASTWVNRYRADQLLLF